MNCLPIVNRELRVAARMRSTFWLRVAAALTALLLGSGCLLMSLVHGVGGSEMGTALFYILTWLCLAAGLSAGLFFTSDCLSEEKREGTLGLLFLTDLRGYDVVLGKLLATSLRGFYALLAVFPILATTLLVGGITGEQYWKSVLALVNALFVSLAVGMAISAISRDSQKALTATLLVLLLLALGGPLADPIIARVTARGFWPRWSLSSPGYVLAAASSWGRHPYWSALLITNLIGWAMLAAACALAPRTWQERKRAVADSARNRSYAWRYGGVRRRLRLRQRLLVRHPIAWLACRERWQSLGLWAVALLVVGGFTTAALRLEKQETWIIWNYVGGLFTFILYLWAASQACRFLVEARRSGLLELLLAAPVSSSQIVSGQWRALLRMFGLPVLLLVGIDLSASALSQLGFQRVAGQFRAVTSAVATNQSGTATSRTVSVGANVTVSGVVVTNAAPMPFTYQGRIAPNQAVMVVVAAAAAALRTGANLLALCWFGMWMGMTSRSANLATLKTFLFVQVIPWFVITFGASMGLGLLMATAAFRSSSAQPAAFFMWVPLVSALFGCGAAVAKDIGFIVWSRNKLRFSLRDEAARSLGQPRFTAPPPRAGAVPAPPVIPVPQ